MKVSLEVVQPDLGKDAVVCVTAGGFPILKGAENTHPACGRCGAVLAWNMSTDTIRKLFTSVHRVAVRCECGACNLFNSSSYLGSRLQSVFALPADETFARP